MKIQFVEREIPPSRGGQSNKSPARLALEGMNVSQTRAAVFRVEDFEGVCTTTALQSRIVRFTGLIKASCEFKSRNYVTRIIGRDVYVWRTK